MTKYVHEVDIVAFAIFQSVLSDPIVEGFHKNAPKLEFTILLDNYEARELVIILSGDFDCANSSHGSQGGCHPQEKVRSYIFQADKMTKVSQPLFKISWD